MNLVLSWTTIHHILSKLMYEDMIHRSNLVLHLQHLGFNLEPRPVQAIKEWLSEAGCGIDASPKSDIVLEQCNSCLRHKDRRDYFSCQHYETDWVFSAGYLR